MLKSLFFLIIGFVQFFAYRVDNNNSIINGSFDGAWNIDFSIYTYNSEGLVLYISDLQSRLLLRFKAQDLIASFNSKKKKIPLGDICGCNICSNFLIHFRLNKTKFVKVETKCRNIHKEFLIDETWNSDNWKYFPLSEENEKDKSIFWMGNIKKHFNKINIYKFKDDLPGCLLNFTFNNVCQYPQEVTEYFKSQCSECYPSICNEGLCKKESKSKNIMCNCANTALNGDYCDKDLQEYKYSDHIYPLYVYPKVNDFEIKFSWKHESTERLCLMELSDEKGSVIIVSDKNKLMIDNEIFENLQLTKNYFFWINFTKNNTSLSNNKNRTYINVFGDVKIKIGLSEHKKCSNFSGKYDLDYDKSKILNVKKNEKRTSKAQKGFVGFFMSNVTISTLGLIFIGTIVFFTTMVLIMLNIIIKLRKKEIHTNVEYSSVQYNMEPDSNIERNPVDYNALYDMLDYNNVTDMDYITPNSSTFRNIFENEFSVDPPSLPPRN